MCAHVSVNLGGRRLKAVKGQVEGVILDTSLLTATMDASPSVEQDSFKIQTVQLGDTAESEFAAIGASLAASIPINAVGSYRVELLHSNMGPARTLCSLFERLHVDCNAEEGYFQDRSGCKLKSETRLQVVMGVCIGAVLAICVGILAFLVRRNPKKAKTIALSFMRTHNGLPTMYAS